MIKQLDAFDVPGTTSLNIRFRAASQKACLRYATDSVSVNLHLLETGKLPWLLRQVTIDASPPIASSDRAAHGHKQFCQVGLPSIVLLLPCLSLVWVFAVVYGNVPSRNGYFHLEKFLHCSMHASFCYVRCSSTTNFYPTIYL